LSIDSIYIAVCGLLNLEIDYNSLVFSSSTLSVSTLEDYFDDFIIASLFYFSKSLMHHSHEESSSLFPRFSVLE
jgi:hypothetical protein